MKIKYQIKAIISGSIVEIYRYGLPVGIGKDREIARNGVRSDFKASGEDSEMKADKSLGNSLRRTRNTLRRLINANAGKWNERDKFFTLTFEKNITDHEQANALFREFIKRLNRKILKKQSGLKYVCVVERQERGALHYHLVMFNMPYMSVADLAEIWGHGFVSINAIDHVDNLGAYVVKYMEKTMCEMQNKKTAKVKDKKMYFTSLGLHKPVEISDGTKQGGEEILKVIEKVKDHEVFRQAYESEYYETFEVTQYNLDRRS